MAVTRKRFLKQVGGSIAALSAAGVGFTTPTVKGSLGMYVLAPENDNEEGYWAAIAQQYYKVSRSFINLENGYFGLQPQPVLQACQAYQNQVNEEGALFARKAYPALEKKVIAKIAGFLGVEEEEVLLTRNATEALNIAIQGYPWKQGDEVLVNQLDYYSMIETFQMLESRGILKVKRFEMPLLPASPDAILQEYVKQIGPNTRVILLTQVSNITGLIVPVKQISAFARARGIDTITDSAHALGHIAFDLKEMGSDFVGMNLHKWMGNPLGAGLLYVKKDRIASLRSLFGDKNPQNEKISRLAHVGTTPFAIRLSIPHAIDFHEQIGISRIQQRMQYLKNRWVNQVIHQPKIKILTPDDHSLSCGIASFLIEDQSVQQVENTLLTNFNIFTVGRQLGEQGCIRVTPGLYTSVDDVDALAKALLTIAA